MERTAVVQKTQIGVETTPGMAVAASKRLLAVSIEPDPQVTVQEFTPMGDKYTTIVADQREWMQAAIRGYPSYGDIIYLLSSCISAPTVTQYMDGGTPTGVYKWVFDSDSSGLDAPVTYTVEQGDAVRAHRFAGSLFREMSLKFSRQAAELSGQLLGQRLQDGITLTAAPTAVELEPMLSGQFDFFVDATFGGLGTTKVGRLFDGTWALGNRFGAFWPVDSSLTSYGGTVELKPTLTFTGIVEANSAGMAYLTTLRNGSTVFSRIRALNSATSLYSAGIYAGGAALHHQCTIDTAMKVSNIQRFSDQEGVYAVEFVFAGVEDAGWTKALHVEVVNKTAAL